MSDNIDSTEQNNVNTESLLMHSDNRRKCLIYFCIYVHLDKAKIANLTRLKAASDVVKR